MKVLRITAEDFRTLNQFENNCYNMKQLVLV